MLDEWWSAVLGNDLLRYDSRRKQRQAVAFAERAAQLRSDASEPPPRPWLASESHTCECETRGEGVEVAPLLFTEIQ